MEGEALFYFSVELGDGFFLGGDVGDAEGDHGAADITSALHGGFDSPGEVVAALGKAGSGAGGYVELVGPETAEHMEGLRSLGELVGFKGYFVRSQGDGDYGGSFAWRGGDLHEAGEGEAGFGAVCGKDCCAGSARLPRAHESLPVFGAVVDCEGAVWENGGAGPVLPLRG